MKKLVFFLLVIFGALYLGAQDTTVISLDDLTKETKIVITVDSSIWKNVFTFKDGATALKNYYVWQDKKPRDLQYEDSLVKYAGFKRYAIETTKVLLSDSVSGKNIIIPKQRPKASSFAYEIIFIFVISTIIILILQSIKNKGKNFEQVEYVISALVVLFTIPFFTTEIGIGVRTVLFYTAIPLFSLVFCFLFKKKTKLITTYYFLMNLLSSIIIIIFFPKIVPLLIANIAGLILGMIIICLKKIKKKKSLVGYKYNKNPAIIT